MEKIKNMINLRDLIHKTLGEVVFDLRYCIYDCIFPLMSIGYAVPNFYFTLYVEGTKLEESKIEDWENLHFKYLKTYVDGDLCVLAIETEEDAELLKRLHKA